MVKMPWNRNKNTSGARVPAEVEEYYQSTRRERRGVAWLLGIATLLLTLAIAAALFFGGRWLYRTLTNNDEPASESTSQDANQSPEQSATEGEGQPENTENNQTNGDQPATNEQNNGSSAPTPAPGSSPAPSSGGSSTPSTGPAEEIPRTGPTEE